MLPCRRSRTRRPARHRRLPRHGNRAHRRPSFQLRGILERWLDAAGRHAVGDAGRPVPAPRRSSLTVRGHERPCAGLVLDGLDSDATRSRLGSVTRRAGHRRWTDCTIPWITTGEVWQIRDDRIEYLSETREMISELGRELVSRGSPAGTVVLSGLRPQGSRPSCHGMATSARHPDVWSAASPRYLLLCLRAMRPDLLGRALGPPTRPSTSPTSSRFASRSPPQRNGHRRLRLWTRLSGIDGCHAIRRPVDLLLERRQALITAAVTGQLEIPGVAA